MTVMEVETMSPVVTGLTTKRSTPANIPGETVTSRRSPRGKAGPSVTIAVQEEGSGIPDLRAAVDKINNLLALPEGWDGFRAGRVTVDAAIAMLHALLAVMDRGSLPPQFFPLPDGGLQAEWHVSGSSIEIEVSGDGRSGCALADGETEAESEFTFPLQRDQLAEFRKILSAFSAQARRFASR
ncbi:hypothetical protein P1P75_16795 [Streptomyces sp. ID05-39B]|uniref:hypothetical protein n=1 Tax=Streptomyces sp. ID05-39B TaxID=3028664 RepID=UPI0029A3EFEF|nr:hypothetical protein [Streptomyces sp. ID05-39B]MDX3528048.1 hypothetical protein [Streptomyces sp. ID05-39B]